MLHSAVDSKGMSQHQIRLIERALRILAKLDEGGWIEMPLDLRTSFAKYMNLEVWTHLPDVLTLRDAALLIIRDAIVGAGEFGPDADGRENNSAPAHVLVAK